MPLTLAHDRDTGLADHADEVVAAIDAVTDPDLVLVGHSYAGLVVRQAADLRPDRVANVVLVDGWAGPDGASLTDLAPGWFTARVTAAANADGLIAPPAPASFGITEPDDARWLEQRLRPHALRRSPSPPASPAPSTASPAPASTACRRRSRSPGSPPTSATGRCRCTARTTCR